jgi:hypothetical protein
MIFLKNESLHFASGTTDMLSNNVVDAHVYSNRMYYRSQMPGKGSTGEPKPTLFMYGEKMYKVLPFHGEKWRRSLEERPDSAVCTVPCQLCPIPALWSLASDSCGRLGFSFCFFGRVNSHAAYSLTILVRYQGVGSGFPDKKNGETAL